MPCPRFPKSRPMDDPFPRTVGAKEPTGLHLQPKQISVWVLEVSDSLLLIPGGSVTLACAGAGVAAPAPMEALELADFCSLVLLGARARGLGTGEQAQGWLQHGGHLSPCSSSLPPGYISGLSYPVHRAGMGEVGKEWEGGFRPGQARPGQGSLPAC